MTSDIIEVVPFPMLYNVYVGTKPNSYFIIGLEEKQVKKIVTAFHETQHDVMVRGIKIFLSELIALVVFDNSKMQSNYNANQLDFEADKISRIWFRSNHISLKTFKEMGKDVTDKFEVGEKIKHKNITASYISLDRIEELNRISKNQFDLTKLIRLCEELNSSNQELNWFAVGSLTRAIIDHIPPIFSCKKFSEVANNYSAPGKIQSFKQSMEQLDKSMRKISDSFLHSHITKSETLPNDTQVDCKRDLDRLLEEIVRILK